MLFGWQRVSPRAHFFATLMVALGTLMSTFWILASNSFMQTPQGFAMENGRIVPVDWMKVIFNPSFPVPARAYDHRRVHCRGLHCRRVRGVASVAWPA